MRTNIAQHSMDKYRENLESALTHDELQVRTLTHKIRNNIFFRGYFNWNTFVHDDNSTFTGQKIKINKLGILSRAW